MTSGVSEGGRGGALWILAGLFFVFGFITWLNSVLIPYLKIACELSNLQAYMVTFSFYLSYLIMGIPSGILLKKIGFKRGMTYGLFVMAIGTAIFLPAAFFRNYYIFLLGLFGQGMGLSVLQTASNPYVTILGDLQSAARRISVMGICNKLAGGIAPIILGTVIMNDSDKIVENLKNLSQNDKEVVLDQLANRVIDPYIVITVVLVLLGVLLKFSGLPEINNNEPTGQTKSPSRKENKLFNYPQLYLGIIAMFFYVGLEVITGDTIIMYGTEQGLSFSVSKFFTTLTLLFMIVGYIVGFLCIPRYIGQNLALRLSAVLGILFTIIAVFSNGLISVLFVSLLGLSNALIFPGIWPKAIESLGSYTKKASAYLVMAFVGGAILPVIYGGLADLINYQLAYLIMIPGYLFIFYYSRQKFDSNS